jgi:hypothetical protein
MSLEDGTSRRKKSGTVFLTDWLAGNNGEMPYRVLENGK